MAKPDISRTRNYSTCSRELRLLRKLSSRRTVLLANKSQKHYWKSIRADLLSTNNIWPVDGNPHVYIDDVNSPRLCHMISNAILTKTWLRRKRSVWIDESSLLSAKSCCFGTKLTLLCQLCVWDLKLNLYGCRWFTNQKNRLWQDFKHFRAALKWTDLLYGIILSVFYADSWNPVA